MVCEVLLGLVEDQVDVAMSLRALDRLDQLAGLDPRPVGHRLRERRSGVVPPVREHRHERLLGKLAQLPGDRGQEQGRLTDPARPVQHREARGDEVRDDDLGIALASEEVQRVELGVVEGGETTVRRRDAHAWASSRRPSRPTYSSGSTASTSTSKRRQKARSSGVGSGSTAHDR